MCKRDETQFYCSSLCDPIITFYKLLPIHTLQYPFSSHVRRIPTHSGWKILPTNFYSSYNNPNNTPHQNQTRSLYRDDFPQSLRANGSDKKEIQNEKANPQDTDGRNDKGNQGLEIRKNTSVIQTKYMIKKKKIRRTPCNQGKNQLGVHRGSFSNHRRIRAAAHMLKRVPRIN